MLGCTTESSYVLVFGGLHMFGWAHHFHPRVTLPEDFFLYMEEVYFGSFNFHEFSFTPSTVKPDIKPP
jgi:hypothetical protein